MLQGRILGDAEIPVTFHQAKVSTNKYGDKTTVYVDVPAVALFAPATSSEIVNGQSTGVTAPAALYLTSDQPVPDANWTVTVPYPGHPEGLLFTIEGDPQVWQGAGIVVELKRFGTAVQT